MTTKKYLNDHPKHVLELLVWNELGDDLLYELEQADCELVIDDDLSNYSFTNITPELKIKVDAKKQEAEDLMKPDADVFN